MLTKLKVENFRLLRSVEIDFEPGKPVVLIGPNSSGKTTVLTVLEFLRRAATEGLASTQAMGPLRTLGGAPPKIEISVGMNLRPWASARDFFRHIPLGLDMTYRLGMVELGPLDIVQHEVITKRDDQSGEAHTLCERTRNGARIANHMSEENDALDNLPSGALILESVKQGAFYPWLDEARVNLSRICIYGEFLTTPLWARDARETSVSPADSAIVSPTPMLGRRGLDLVNALFHIHNEDPAGWEEILDAFRAEFPFVERLEFPADPSGGKIGLGWRDRRFRGVRLSGYQMSEGMLSWLCLLAALFSVDQPSLIGFDEPDLHLHPSAVRRLVHLIEVRSHKTPIIVATHSDRLLEHLSDPAGSIRVCEPTAGGVEIRTLDREALDEWRTSYSLSELRGRGHLDSSNESPSLIDS